MATSLELIDGGVRPSSRLPFYTMRERAFEAEATAERIARAVDKAAHGESTLLACRGSLSVSRAVAIAEQHRRLVGLESEIRITAGHGRVHIHPASRPVRRRVLNRPGGFDRRSVFDRRVEERRKIAADDPIAVAAIRLNGERRSGTDRRSGVDRRRGVPRQSPL